MNFPAKLPRGAPKLQFVSSGKDVSDCLLSTSWFTAAFVIVGTFVGVKRKSYYPLAAAAVLGSIGDGLYGYYFSCAEIIKDYDTSKRQI